MHWCAYKRLHRPWARLHTTCTYYIQIQLESFRTTLTALLHAVSHADVDSWSASLLLSPDDTQSAETSPRVSRMFILPVFCDGGTCGAVACRGRAVGLRIVVSVSRSSPPVCEVVDGESLSGSGERVSKCDRARTLPPSIVRSCGDNNTQSSASMLHEGRDPRASNKYIPSVTCSIILPILEQHPNRH